MAYIPQALRDFVTRRANGFCEYCQANQAIVMDMEIDHIVPESRDGRTDAANLCLSCPGCNQHKLNFETGIDPESSLTVTLFNPRTQSWNEHFRWDDSGAVLVGLTPTGRATVNRLKINRANAVSARKTWVSVGLHPPKTD